MSRLQRPLDKAAVRKADDAFYARHPEYVSADGTRRPLTADDPLAEEWRRLYVENGGKIEPDAPQDSEQAGEPVQECPKKKKGLYDRIRWWMDPVSKSKAAVQQVWCDGFADETLGVQFCDGAIAQLELHQSVAVPLASGTMLEVEFDVDGGKKTVTESLRVDGQQGDLVRVDVPFAVFERVLRGLGTRLHHTWLRAWIPAVLSQSGARVRSPNAAYPLLQHALFFLPGVLGSRLWVRNPDGEEEECFPEVSMFGDIELELLVCKPDGTPRREVLRNKLAVLEKVAGLKTVYDCRRQATRIADERFPRVWLDAGKQKRARTLLYVEIPYDWRLDIRKSHKDLATEIYTKLLELEGPEPFLDTRVSLAGHSTGGVIMRGLAATQNELTGRIRHCFFINVPHWGAPKAEFVYLTGDMEIPVMTNKASFRQMSPDMPIVYFLCASSPYGNAIGEDWTPRARKARIDAAIAAKAYDTKKKKLYGHAGYANEGRLTFNDAVAKSAEDYVADTNARGPSADVAAWLFHSGGHPTAVGTRVDGGDVKVRKTLVGDGTVPTVSQLADIAGWKRAALFSAIPGDPEHVPAPNSAWLWDRIADVLQHADVAKHTIPWPRGIKALRTMILNLARSTQKGNDSQITFEEHTLAAGAKRQHDHGDMDCGVVLVECKAGQITVRCSAKVWSGFQPINERTIGAGDWTYTEFTSLATSDQTNRVEIEAHGDASYRIDFVSCDY